MNITAGNVKHLVEHVCFLFQIAKLVPRNTARDLIWYQMRATIMSRVKAKRGNRVDIKLVDLAAEPVNTWSATKPAYPFTPACPDVRYRPGGELYGVVIKRRRS